MNSNFNIPELESLYPKIYRELHPFILEGAGELVRAGRITEESISRMADDIIFRCGLSDEDEDYSVYGFDPWFNDQEVINDTDFFDDAEFVMARPQPQRPMQRPSQNRPHRPSRPPHRPQNRSIVWPNYGYGHYNHNLLRDLLKILILREIAGN